MNRLSPWLETMTVFFSHGKEKKNHFPWDGRCEHDEESEEWNSAGQEEEEEEESGHDVEFNCATARRQPCFILSRAT